MHSHTLHLLCPAVLLAWISVMLAGAAFAQDHSQKISQKTTSCNCSRAPYLRSALASWRRNKIRREIEPETAARTRPLPQNNCLRCSHCFLYSRLGRSDSITSPAKNSLQSQLCA